jgi:hypothetical protein
MDPSTKRRMDFRRCLNGLSNQLSRQNLDDMKFVCKDHVPVARMERVRNPLDIFQALEERGKLAMNDTSFLVKVLITIERSNLVSDLIRAGFAPVNALEMNPTQTEQPMQLPPQQQPQQQNREFLFNKMLLKIAQNLSARDVESLTYTWADSILGMNSDRISSATQLFQLLQQRQIVTQTNVQALYNELETIGRSDLSKRINNYLQQIGERPCQMPMDGDGRPMQGGTMPLMSTATMIPTEETHSHMTTVPPPQPQAPQQGYHNRAAYGTSQAGQPISSPTDTDESMASHAGMSYSSGLPSSQLSYPSTASSSSTLTAQTGEHDYHHETQQHTFVPNEVYPIRPQSGFSVEETGGRDVPLQDEPLGLTFPTNEEVGQDTESEPGMSRGEVQDLKTQWNQTQELLAVKELEKKQLCKDLDHLQQENAKIIEEREGESLQHQADTRELELALQKKIEEIELLRQQVQGLQRTPRQIPDMNPDELYPLDKNPHGVCLIINNHRFYHETDQSKAHPDRGGAEIDQYNLTQTFRYLRYKVEVLENLTADRMTDTLMHMSQRDHSNYDSFVCCILSHGEHDIIHGANSEPVNVNDLTGLMKLSATLRNKPKLFFIQCCRGEAEEVGFEKDNPGESSTFRSTIPRDTDFFLGYATPLGKAAYRSRKHGSWYISELCKVFTQYGYQNSLSSMMRRVNRQVSNAFTKDGYKQCAEFVDRLRREVHFFHFIRNRTKPSQ